MSNYVFLDTEIFVKCNFSLESQNFTTLISHIEKENIFLVTSEIIIREIKKHIQTEVQKAVNGILAFPILNKLDMFDYKVKDKKELKRIFFDNIWSILDERLLSYAEVVGIAESSVNDIFNDYFDGKSPFLSGKPEFPDAFAANSLLNWARKNGHSIAIVSGNTKDWEKICDREEYASIFSFYKDLSSFLESLIQIIDSKRKEIITQVQQLFPREFSKAFENVELELDVNLQTFDEDVCPELDDKSLRLEIEEINITSYSQAEDTAELEVQGKVTFSAYVDCPDPNSGYYDSEEKEIAFYWDRYTGNVEATRDFVCLINISEKNGDYKIDSCEIDAPKRIELSWGTFYDDYSPADIFTTAHSIENNDY